MSEVKQPTLCTTSLSHFSHHNDAHPLKLPDNYMMAKFAFTKGNFVFLNLRLGFYTDQLEAY